MPTSLGNPEDATSWSLVASSGPALPLASSSAEHWISFCSGNGVTSNAYSLAGGQGAGLFKVTMNTDAITSNNLSYYLGFVNPTASTTSTTTMGSQTTFYGFTGNNNGASASVVSAGVNGSSIQSWVTGNTVPFPPQDYYVSWSSSGSGGTLVLALYKNGVGPAYLQAVTSVTAPTFTSFRPVFGIFNGGSFSGVVSVYGAPWFETSPTAYPITNLRGYGSPARADVAFDKHPVADSYDYRVNGGSITNVADAAAPIISITGLTNGTTYTIDVRPSCGASKGNWQTVTVIPNASSHYDNFNRTDSSTSLGTATNGQTYTTQNSSTWGLTGGLAYNPGNNANAIVTVPGFADCDIQAQIASNTNQPTGLIFRYTDVNNYWRLVFDTANGLRLWRRTSGGEATMWLMGTSAIALGDRIRIWAMGSEIRVYRYCNSTSQYMFQGSIIDPWNTTATICGMYINTNNNAPRLDMFSVQPAQSDPSPATADKLDTSDVALTSSWSQPSWLYKGRDTYSDDLAGVS